MTGRALPDMDDGLLLRASVKDPEAFGVFYDRYVHDILAFFYKRTSDPHTAADLTAETFAEALRGAKRFVPERGDPKAWLVGIAKFQLSHYFRTQKTNEKSMKKLGIATVHLDDISIERIESMIDSAAQRSAVIDGLQTMSPGVREAVLLRVVQDRPFKEVAQIMGCSTGAARVRVSRGISHLARAVNG